MFLKLKQQTLILLRFNNSKEVVQTHIVARKFHLATAKKEFHQDKLLTLLHQVDISQLKIHNQLCS